MYRLLEELGAGGMGRVFLAEHVKLGRRVALKVLQPELWHNRRSVQRFFQEARLVNRIDHENIVQIHDYVQESDGLSYLIMELLVGRDLMQSHDQDGAFALSRAVSILRQVTAALTAAHQQGVVHRDLKPGNIFLLQKPGRPDFVKLLDFGIAKLQDDSDIEAPHTRTGSIVGTPLYMSPEQASGESVDARSDLYSLGVVAYWMLADAFPFKAKSFAELLTKQQTQPPGSLPSHNSRGEPLPPALAAVVARCLQRDRGARYQTALELDAALATASAGVSGLGEGAASAGAQTTVARPRTREAVQPTVEMRAPSPREHRAVWPPLLAAALAFLVVGVGYLRWSPRAAQVLPPILPTRAPLALPPSLGPSALAAPTTTRATAPSQTNATTKPSTPDSPVARSPREPSPGLPGPEAASEESLNKPPNRSLRVTRRAAARPASKPLTPAKTKAHPTPTSDDDVLDPFHR